MNGWGRVWLRFGAMAAVVLILGLLAKWKSNEARQRNVVAITLQSEGWVHDKFFGAQFRATYGGLAGKLGVDTQSFRDLYAALGTECIAEPMQGGGCMLTFQQKPTRTMFVVYISHVRALIAVDGPVQQEEAEKMVEPILNLAWDAGVKPKRVGSVVKIGDKTQRWEFTFDYTAK